mgnify:CR=1 FL=1
MAKITANGDSEVRRWKGDRGEELVYTRKGRVLRKLFTGEKFTLIAKNATESSARAYAASLGLEEK